MTSKEEFGKIALEAFADVWRTDILTGAPLDPKTSVLVAFHNDQVTRAIMTGASWDSMRVRLIEQGSTISTEVIDGRTLQW